MKLVLIDGHAILHRAYHALPPLTTSKGELVNAVFGFSSILLKVIQDLKPDYLAVCFDLPTPTFRNKLYEGYQAKRPKIDEELKSQIGLIRKVVVEMGMPIYEKDGYEADDVIGTIAKKADADEVIIVTGDRDLLQLIDKKIKAYMPIKGLSESKLYGEKEVEEKFGIKPEQMIDYKALIGDPSDNYLGINGVGPKTAAKLIADFGTLDGIFEHIAQVENEGLKKKLIDGRESAELARKLATIVTDVPLEFDLRRARLPQLDKPNVFKLFEELGFRSLISRLTNRQSMLDKKPIKQQNKKDSGQLSLV